MYCFFTLSFSRTPSAFFFYIRSIRCNHFQVNTSCLAHGFAFLFVYFFSNISSIPNSGFGPSIIAFQPFAGSIQYIQRVHVAIPNELTRQDELVVGSRKILSFDAVEKYKRRFIRVSVRQNDSDCYASVNALLFGFEDKPVFAVNCRRNVFTRRAKGVKLFLDAFLRDGGKQFRNWNNAGQ